MQRTYGWLRDLPDFRDIAYEAAHIGILPTSVDLRSGCSPIMDQGELGSCTSNAATAIMWYDEKKQGKTPVLGSRLFHYYNERSNKYADTGATIRQSVKTANRYGVCPETEWTYDISKFTVQPFQSCYADAKLEKMLTYKSVAQDLGQMQACLAAGFAFLLGFTVYSSFESDAVASNGIVPMPSNTESVLGGHAVMACGYDSGMFYCQNSWGASWGDHGFFYIPQDYLTNPHLAADFWMVTSVQ
ncbi:MAG: C1 family peptidase [Ktedonobacteraceae bacterium]